jgi:hypothetical protein
MDCASVGGVDEIHHQVLQGAVPDGRRYLRGPKERQAAMTDPLGPHCNCRSVGDCTHGRPFADTKSAKEILDHHQAMTLIDVRNENIQLRIALHKTESQLAALQKELEAARGELAQKEKDRQYHMNAINRLASRVNGLGKTSDEVVELALRKQNMTAKLIDPQSWKNLAKALGSPEAEEISHWSDRAEKAEAANKRLREALEKVKAACDLYSIPMLKWAAVFCLKELAALKETE